MNGIYNYYKISILDEKTDTDASDTFEEKSKQEQDGSYNNVF